MYEIILKEIAKHNGFNQEKNFIHGVSNDYYVTVNAEEGLSCGISFFANDTSIVYAIKDALSKEEIFSKFNAKRLVVGESFIYVDFYEIATSNNIIDFINYYTELLTDYDVSGCDVCPLCGKTLYEKDTETVIADNMVLPLHTQCAKLFNEHSKPSAVNNILPITACFIGPMLITIPWQILRLIGIPSGILGLLIPLLAILGYDLFKGENSSVRKITVAIVSFIWVFLAEFLSLLIDFSGGKLSAFAALINELGHSETLQNGVMLNLSIGIIFAATGVIGFIKLIKPKRK